MTEKLYYNDANTEEFQAEIIQIIPEKNQWKAELDRTYFYPEGGGQPADKGWIAGIPVLDVQKVQETIYHIMPASPPRGTVTGKIDMKWRRDFMQQHTGQHIISGALYKVGQYVTQSVHMGIDYTSIEIDQPQISPQHIQQVEEIANTVIRDDLPIEFIFTQSGQVDAFQLRKPSSREGQIRLVRIADFDCVACGGIHFNSTRHVRLVKAIGIEKIRGHARILWKIGDRAIADYTSKDRLISELRSLLSTGDESLPQKTRELIEELAQLKRKCSQYENQHARFLYTQLMEKNSIGNFRGVPIITRYWTDGEEEESVINKMIKILLKEQPAIFCLVYKASDRLNWCIGCTEGVEYSFDKNKQELMASIDGKGGGSYPLWKGIGKNESGMEQFFTRFRASLQLP